MRAALNTEGADDASDHVVLVLFETPSSVLAGEAFLGRIQRGRGLAPSSHQFMWAQTA